MSNSIESNLLSAANPLRNEYAPSPLEVAAPKGKTLTDIFNQDTFEDPLKNSIQETQTLSFWKKIINYFFQAKETAIPPLATTNEVKESMQVEPISRVPILDEPENIPHKQIDENLLEPINLNPDIKANISDLINNVEDMAQALLRGAPPDDPQVAQAATQVLATVDHLIQQEDLTIEQIMHAVTKLVIQRQEETGIVATELYKRLQELSRTTLEQFQRLEDKAQKDKKVSDYFSYANMVVATTTAICTVILVGSLFFPPLAAAIPAAQMIQLAAGMGTALTKAGEGYFKYSSNQNHAEALGREKEREIFKGAGTTQNERMLDSLEATKDAQSGQIKLAQKHKHLVDIVMQK